MIYTYVLAAMLALANFGIGSAPAVYKSVGCDFFGSENAARLLGPKFRGEDTGMKEAGGTKSWGCTFLRTDDGHANSPRIHFAIKKAATVEMAIEDFANVRGSNNTKAGWSEWLDVGEEAIIHTNEPTFHLVMIRKGVQTITVKINPANGIALSEVKDIMARLSTKLS